MKIKFLIAVGLLSLLSILSACSAQGMKSTAAEGGMMVLDSLAVSNQLSILRASWSSTEKRLEARMGQFSPDEQTTLKESIAQFDIAMDWLAGVSSTQSGAQLVAQMGEVCVRYATVRAAYLNAFDILSGKKDLDAGDVARFLDFHSQAKSADTRMMRLCTGKVGAVDATTMASALGAAATLISFVAN